MWRIYSGTYDILDEHAALWSAANIYVTSDSKIIVINKLVFFLFNVFYFIYKACAESKNFFKK